MNRSETYQVFCNAEAELHKAEEIVRVALANLQAAGLTAPANDVQAALNELADVRYAIASDSARVGVEIGTLP